MSFIKCGTPRQRPVGRAAGLWLFSLALHPIRLLASAKALSGLLLIGWTASCNDMVMARFWTQADLPM